MKKQDVINLVKYHVQGDNESFVAETSKIASDFNANGDEQIARYLMELIADANFYVPQANYANLRFLHKEDPVTQPLFLPETIEEDVISIARSIKKKSGLSKFLFYGAPGTGKTESAYQIARLLGRDLLVADFEKLIDSRLGESAKNIALLFDEIKHVQYERVIILFDEIDALVLDRINSNDLREMGRVTSAFLKGMDSLSEKIAIIATTNLYENFDKALIRRFDATISFDRYSKEDLVEIADILMTSSLKKSQKSRQDVRLFNKILNQLVNIPYPGDLKRIIKTAVAFSNEENEYDYLRKIYLNLLSHNEEGDIQKLRDAGFTTREIEILTKIPKSSVSRKLRKLDESDLRR